MPTHANEQPKSAGRRRAEESLLATLRGHDDGSVAVLFGLMLAVLMGFVDAAADGAAWLQARNITRSAVDAAVLAGARELQYSSGNAQAALSVASHIYADGVRSRAATVRDEIVFSSADGGTAIVASGRADFGTRALRLIGIDAMTLFPAGRSIVARGVLVLGRNARQHIEISLVLDVSGTTTDAILPAMKVAAADFVRLLLWAEQPVYAIRLALVPFSSAVRLGDELSARIMPRLPSRLPVRLADGSRAHLFRSDCVAERSGPAESADAAPQPGEFPAVYWTGDGCFSARELLPLTADRPALETALAGLTSEGFSAPHVGLAWGWYTLSPAWSRIWPSEPRPYSAPDGEPERKEVRKIVLFASAGDFGLQFCTGAGSEPLAAVADRASALPPRFKAVCLSAGGPSTEQTARMCMLMRTAGLEIHVVAVAPASSERAGDVLRRCATSPDTFYPAAHVADLGRVMRQIAARLTPVYLAD